MIDLTKPVQTRDGRKVRILCTDMKGSFPVVGILSCGDDDEDIANWTLDGRFSCNAIEHPRDIINVPEKLVAYVNFYTNGSGNRIWGTREKADSMASEYRVACIRVEAVEGQFDD